MILIDFGGLHFRNPQMDPNDSYTFFLEKICPASGIEHGYDALTLQSLWPSSV